MMPKDSWMPRGAAVAEPIDPFEPRAVAEVKARHGVDAVPGEGCRVR